MAWSSRHKRARLGALSLLAPLSLLASSPAAANPLDAFGFGSRSIAMGGAVAASVDDFSANYYNPAALADGGQLRLEFGYVYVDSALEMNGGDLDVDASRGVQGGIVMPGEILGQAVGVSIGLHLPDRRVARLRALPQQQPRFVLFDNRPQRLTISASGAVEVFDWLFLGGGLTFLANTQGTLLLGGQIDIFDEEAAELYSGLDVDLSAVRYLTAGALIKAGDHLRFGVTFRDEFKLRLDLGVDVLADLLAGGAPVNEDVSLVVTTNNVNLFSPRQVAFGAAWVDERLTAEVDLTWIQWSAFPAPASTINVVVDDRLAGLASVPPFERPLDPNFSDILVPRVGLEFLWLDTHHVDMRVRAGYFLEPTPAPDQPGVTNYADNTKHGASLGFGLELDHFTDVLSRPLILDVTGQYIRMPVREYTKDDPADPVGDYAAGGRFLGGSLTMKLLFE